MTDEQDSNPRFVQSNWPIGMGQRINQDPESGPLGPTTAKETHVKSRKVVVPGKNGKPDKEMWHHVIRDGQMNSRMRHILSESEDPRDDGVAQVLGHERHHNEHGHHLVLRGKYTPQDQRKKGYMDALFQSMVDFHGAVKGDDSYSPDGEKHSLSMGKKLKAIKEEGKKKKDGTPGRKKSVYTFHPGIKDSKEDKEEHTYDKKTEQVTDTRTVSHNMWFKRADNKPKKPNQLGLINPPTYGW